METPSQGQDLSGKLLIAMPEMGDPRFERSVIFMCAHSDEGAMGLIVNKPAAALSFDDLLDRLEIPHSAQTRPISVHLGGPVENGRGFVLHSPDYHSGEATLEVDARFGLTATTDVLHEISRGGGPKNCFLALGYSGWGPGQLEGEIRQNGWLTCDATPEIVFGTDNDGKWGAALKSMGVDPRMLSSTGGTA